MDMMQGKKQMFFLLFYLVTYMIPQLSLVQLSCHVALLLVEGELLLLCIQCCVFSLCYIGMYVSYR